MPKDNENMPLFDPGPLTPTQPQGFAQDQMVQCAACHRANPPTRVNCLYCGAPFAFDKETAALRTPALRPLEPGESGYTNIFQPAGSRCEVIGEAAALLRLPEESINKILNGSLPLPLARTASVDEAKVIETRLQQLGIKSFIVSDAALRLEKSPPIRIRAAEFSEAGIVLHQVTTDAHWEMPWSKLTLMVEARLTVKSVASKERKASTRENEILDASETQADEAVVDLYAIDSESSFRIAANSFDFSCLGQRKGLLANENFKQLLQLIKENAPQVTLDDSYRSARHSLELVWPSEKRTESRGWRRERLGKVTFGAVTEVSNETQFSRYSRFRHFVHQHPELYEP